MAAWAVWIVGIVLLALEGVLLQVFGVEAMSLQVPLVLTAYVGLRKDLHSSAWILLGWLLPMQWLSGGPQGLHALGAVLCFWALRLGAARFERRWNLVKILLTAAITALHHLILIAVLVITAPASPLIDPILATLPQSAAIAALSSLFIGPLLRRVEQALDPRRGSDGLIL